MELIKVTINENDTSKRINGFISNEQPTLSHPSSTRGSKHIFARTIVTDVYVTRMHSSGMSTVRCSGRLGGGCLPRGWRGPSAWGVYTSPMWTEFLTHAYENITFPQLRSFADGNKRITCWWNTDDFRSETCHN